MGYTNDVDHVEFRELPNGNIEVTCFGSFGVWTDEIPASDMFPDYDR
ncbi:MAG: hypothetical protein IJT43_11860 [Stomatobaculum sp.]|nr:hypothetical protein [Stomatobaculum sp.]